jgi:pilus assembly protein CpaC
MVVPPYPVRAQSSNGAWISEGETARHVVVTVNKSRTFVVARPFSSAVVGSPEIADAIPMTNRTLYIQGKKVGTTNVSVFDENTRLIGVLDVEVAIDTGNLQHKILASTGSRRIHVSSSNGQVVLSGEAGDAAAADRAVLVAKSLNPDRPVVNIMTVAPSQQVMLKVQFLEASRDAGRELGVNWFVSNSNGTRGANIGAGGFTPGIGINGQPPFSPGSTTNNGVPVFSTLGTLSSGSQPFGVLLANVVNSGTQVDVLVSALETKGLVRRLAEPDLVALSGDTASFLAGGEFPVPVAQPAGGGVAVTIEYKRFGVQLAFMPTVLANGLINLRLTPTVSEVDFTNAVIENGFRIPSLITREARTTIELRDGQSFAIAGLLQADNRRDASQLPWIGSVPVLGALFSSKSFQQSETDLIVIVTPHLVAPAVPGQRLATPLDKHLPTNDVDFFLLGQMELRKQYNDYVTSGGGLQGPYGHLIGADQASDPPASKN